MTELVAETQKPTVSHSEAQAFNSCVRKHYYQYGLELESKTRSDALTRGVLGHKMLETFFTARMSGSGMDDSIEATRGFLLDALANGTDPEQVRIVSQAFNWLLKADLPLLTWEILAVEKEFVLELPEIDFRYPFVVDLILRSPRGKTFVIDLKFIYDFYNENDIAIQTQLPRYMAALRLMGRPVDRVGYLMLRTRSLKNPSVDDMIRFEPFQPSETRLMRTFEEYLRTAARINVLKAKPLEEWNSEATRTSETMICDRCPMKRLCAAELNGEDAQLVLNANYKKRTRRTFNVIEQS